MTRIYTNSCPGSISQVTGFEKANATAYSLRTITASLLLDKYGVKPHQWVDYRVITGDTSDGIAGIKGLGEKVAEKVLPKCKSLDRFAAEPFAADITRVCAPSYSTRESSGTICVNCSRSAVMCRYRHLVCLTAWCHNMSGNLRELNRKLTRRIGRLVVTITPDGIELRGYRGSARRKLVIWEQIHRSQTSASC